MALLNIHRNFKDPPQAVAIRGPKPSVRHNQPCTTKFNGNLKKPCVSHETCLEKRRRIPCPFENCDYGAAHNCKLKLHINSRHTPRRTRSFPCSLCPSSFYTDYDLRRHIVRHVKETRFTCDACDFSSHDRQCVRRHVRAQHEKSVKLECKFPGCKFSTFYKSYFNQHGKSHDPDPSIRCPFPCDFPNCDFRTDTKQTLRRHINARHNRNRTKEFPCPLCKRRFYGPPDLQNHIALVHVKEKSVVCDQQRCNYRTHYSTTLQRHRRVKHALGKFLEKTFECDSCDYRAPFKFHVDLHKKSRHAVKGLKCDFAACGFQTNLHYVLKNHKLAHENDPRKQYPFPCKFFPGCDFRRRQKCQIRAHERKHEASKVRLQCTFCTKNYPDRTSFNFHNEMTHINQSYKCSQCHYVTCFQRSIGQHVRHSHNTGQQPAGHDFRRKRAYVSRKAQPLNQKIPIVILTKISLEMW